jgi:hypothetical protein
MPSEQPEVPFSSRFRHGLRTYRAPISGFVLAVGVLLAILAVGFFTPLHTVPPFQAIDASTNKGSDNYNLVFAIVGPIVAIIGGYLVGAYLVARRRFEHLMETKSKAEFLRNIPELEELLWELTPADGDRYEDKRAELRIRR